MKFRDLIADKELDCELIVADTEMPATFVWNGDEKISEYGESRFGKLLDSEAVMLENGNIEIFCNDENMGNSFVWAVAGYINQFEYDRIFDLTDKELSDDLQAET